MKLATRQFSSVNDVKGSLKKGGSNSGPAWVKSIPSEGLTVRFLSEPDAWFGFFEYYSVEDRAFVPMAEGEILPDGAKPSFRYLTNAVDVETDQVLALKIPKSAASSLMLKYDKYSTLTDRDYELDKHGEGLETTYEVTPTAPSPMVLDKYTRHDLEEVLIAARANALGEDMNIEPRGFTDDDVDDDEDDDAVVGDPAPDRRDFMSEPSRAQKTSAAVEVDPFADGMRDDYSDAELRKFSSASLILLLEDWYDDPQLSGEETWDELVAAVHEAQGTDAGGDPDPFDEAELESMTIPELRTLASKVADVSTSVADLDRDDLIELLIEASEA